MGPYTKKSLGAAAFYYHHCLRPRLGMCHLLQVPWSPRTGGSCQRLAGAHSPSCHGSPMPGATLCPWLPHSYQRHPGKAWLGHR